MCWLTLTRLQPLPRLHGPLLGLEQHAEPGARDVLESARSTTCGVRHAVEELQRLVALGGIEPPGQHHFALFTQSISNIAHLPQGLGEGDGTAPVRVLVAQGVGHLAHEVQARARPAAAPERLVDVDRRRRVTSNGSTSKSVSRTVSSSGVWPEAQRDVVPAARRCT